MSAVEDLDGLWPPSFDWPIQPLQEFMGINQWTGTLYPFVLSLFSSQINTCFSLTRS